MTTDHTLSYALALWAVGMAIILIYTTIDHRD